MKSIITLFVAFLVTTISLAQNQFMNYKAVVKDGSGNIVANQSVGVQFEIQRDLVTVYTETHTTTTDSNGLIMLDIGDGTSTDDFSSIVWDRKFMPINTYSVNSLKVGIDITGGTAYTDMGTTDFKSVPYAYNVINGGLHPKGAGWMLEQDFDLDGEEVDTPGLWGVDMTKHVDGLNRPGGGAPGAYSFAAGQNNRASGEASVAIGSENYASGNYSVAFGKSNSADALSSFAVGQFNIGGGNATTWIDTDPLFEIGNGLFDGNNSNALTVLKDGTITAPTLTNALINTAGLKALVTKEYVDALAAASSTGLEKLDEGSGLGWRLIGQNPANYGNIGLNAVDLSISTIASSTNGATGLNSVAMGTDTKASGFFSTAIGQETSASGDASVAIGYQASAGNFNTVAIGVNATAIGDESIAIGYQAQATNDRAIAMGTGAESSGDDTVALGSSTSSGQTSIAMGAGTNSSDLASTSMGLGTNSSGKASTSMGDSTVASGDSSTSMGDNTTSPSFAETVIGSYNTSYAPSSTSAWIPQDRLFVIGNGLNNSTHSDAMVVLKDGTITAPSLTPALINAAGGMSLVTKDYLDGAAGLQRIDLGSYPTPPGWILDNGGYLDGGEVIGPGEGSIDMILHNDFIDSDGNASQGTGVSGIFSFGAGVDNAILGNYSVSFGGLNAIEGTGSAVFGFDNWAFGDYSLVHGSSNRTTGDYISTFGNNLKADALHSFVLGRYNVGGGTASSWVETESILEIGNGTSDGSRSNALTVLKTGKTTVIETSSAFDAHAVNGIKAHVGSIDNVGVYGQNIVTDFYGIGVRGQGGWRGVEGSSNGTGTGGYFGVYGFSNGSNSGINYGVYGSASSGSTNYAVYAAGDLAYTGSLINASDRKLKTNINPVSSILSSIIRLKPSTYSIAAEFVRGMNMSSKPQFGFVAQELKDVFPDLVSNNVHPGATKEAASIEYLGVNYIGLIPILTKGIQEQQEQIETLNEKVASQDQTIASLIARIEALENR